MLLGQGRIITTGAPQVTVDCPAYAAYEMATGENRVTLQVHSSVAPDSVQWARVSSTYNSEAVFSDLTAASTDVLLSYSETYVLSVTLTFGAMQIVQAFSIDALTPYDAFEATQTGPLTASFIAVLTSGFAEDGQMVIAYGDGQSESFGQNGMVENHPHVYPAPGQYTAQLRIETPRYTAMIASITVDVI